MIVAGPAGDEQSRFTESRERGRDGGDRDEHGPSPKEFLLERIVKPARARGEGLPDAPHGRVQVELALADASGEAGLAGAPQRVEMSLGRRGGETRPGRSRHGRVEQGDVRERARERRDRPAGYVRRGHHDAVAGYGRQTLDAAGLDVGTGQCRPGASTSRVSSGRRRATSATSNERALAAGEQRGELGDRRTAASVDEAAAGARGVERRGRLGGLRGLTVADGRRGRLTAEERGPEAVAAQAVATAEVAGGGAQIGLRRLETV